MRAFIEFRVCFFRGLRAPQEINHRVKNSLQLVGSMFNLQARRAKDPSLVQALHEAYGRVTAVARVHERLYLGSEVGSVDLSAYLKAVCDDLQGVTAENKIVFKAQEPIEMSTDRAVLVALLVGELVTNAAKHAYPVDAPWRSVCGVSGRRGRRVGECRQITIQPPHKSVDPSIPEEIAATPQ